MLLSLSITATIHLTLSRVSIRIKYAIRDVNVRTFVTIMDQSVIEPRHRKLYFRLLSKCNGFIRSFKMGQVRWFWGWRYCCFESAPGLSSMAPKSRQRNAENTPKRRVKSTVKKYRSVAKANAHLDAPHLRMQEKTKKSLQTYELII